MRMERNILTLVQNSPPLIVRPLIGIRHLILLRSGRSKQSAQERDRGHGSAELAICCERRLGAQGLRGADAGKVGKGIDEG